MLPATIERPVAERLQMPDVRQLERMPSLPAWVALRVGSLKRAVQPDRQGKWREILTLPASLILKAEESEEIARHASELHALCRQTPKADPEAEKVTFRAVMEMMMVLPSATQNEFSIEARGAAFMAALDDISTWAVQAAIRHLHRGEWGNNDNGYWCPVPAELRKFSRREMYRVKWRAEDLGKLLLAEPLIEFSDEHRKQMQNLLGGIFRNSRPSPVGTDGSGGVIGMEPIQGAHCGTQLKHSPA